MSKIESRVVTIKCNRFGCDKEKVYVNVGAAFETDEQWSTVEFDETLDLCPEHDEELRDFFYGPDDDNPTKAAKLIEKMAAEDMESDIGDPRTDWDGPRG